MSSDFPSDAPEADSSLLRAFAAGRDESAFRRLTERYAGLVHGIALRRLGDNAAAQEVTSEVFILLAVKAARLTRPGCLAAWLQRSAVLITANTARRETRRRLAMNAYSASLPPAGTAASVVDEPAWAGVLAHLDQCITILPERDRRLILARYFAGKNYGEIAGGEGSTEQSVKKAGQRALARLRILLIRRGVSLSATALATGLPRRMQAMAAAPEGLVAQVASTALAFPRPGPVFTLFHTLSHMFYGKPLTSAAAALLLCAVLGGGSFLTARQLAVRLSVFPKGPAVSPPASNDSSPEISTGKPPVRSPGEILREAVALLKRSSKNISPEMDRAVLLLLTLTPEQMPEAARAAADWREDLPFASTLARALAAAWGEKDPAAALAWLEVFPHAPQSPGDGGADKIMLSWFQKDSPAAWNWWVLRSRKQPPPLAGWGELIGRGAGQWARKDPAAATAAVGVMTDRRWRIVPEFARRLAQLEIPAESPAIDAALQWNDPSLRAELAFCLAKARKNGGDPFNPQPHDLDRLFPLLNRLCDGDPAALEAALSPVVKFWAGQEPAKAADWILQETAGTPANTRQLLAPALAAWGMNASTDAWDWVRTRIGEDPERTPRLYDGLLKTDSYEPEENEDGSRGLWLSRTWAQVIAEGPEEPKDRLLRYWAQERLREEAASGLSPDSILTRWRSEISAAEAAGKTAAAGLARGALQFAEEVLSTPTPPGSNPESSPP